MNDPPYPTRVQRVVDELMELLEQHDFDVASGPARTRAVTLLEELQEQLEQLDRAPRGQHALRGALMDVLAQVAAKLIVAILDSQVWLHPQFMWRRDTWLELTSDPSSGAYVRQAA